MKKPNVLIQENNVVMFVEQGNVDKTVQVCNVLVDMEGNLPYYRMVLRFPDGSFRQFFISYNSLIPKN